MLVQYQQNEQSPLTLTRVTLENPCLAWDRNTNVAGLNRLIGSQHFPIDALIIIAIIDSSTLVHV
jgi:hypothetical protein